MQMMPDGKNNLEYFHNHVLRAAVNGDWGTDFTIHEGEEKAQTFTYQLDEKWVPVAFVYTDSGVAQVEKAKVVFTPVAPAE